MSSLDFSRGVILKGLPFDTSERDIKAFFKNITIPDENIRFIKFRDGKHTGVGFVKLRNEDMEHALLMDRNHIGKRYIEVVASDETELHHLSLKARSGESDAKEINRMAGREAQRGVVKRDRSPIRKHLHTRYAYITGIPPNNQYKEVRQFFRGISIGMNCIHLLKKEDCGDFRGDGYIEFRDSEECRRGLLLDGKMMNGGLIRLEPCNIDELESAVIPRKDGFNRRSPSPRRPGDRRSNGGGEEEAYFTPAYREREGRYRSTIANMAYGGNVVDHPKSFKAEDSYSDRWGGRLPYSDSPSERGRSDAGYRPPPANASNQSYGHLEPLLTSYGGGLLGPTPQKPVLGSISSPPRVERRIIRMEGLPYDTGLQDVVEFFRGFNVGIDHVRIQCRDDGSPSGKAFVTLPNEKFARNAIQELNKRYILGRYVELFLV